MGSDILIFNFDFSFFCEKTYKSHNLCPSRKVVARVAELADAPD